MIFPSILEAGSQVPARGIGIMHNSYCFKFKDIADIDSRKFSLKFVVNSRMKIPVVILRCRGESRRGRDHGDFSFLTNQS